MQIRGRVASREELLAASGYQNRPGEFRELLEILDAELRLITPTDPEGKDEGGRMKDETTTNQSFSGSSFIPHPSSFYQLTHDYLVPSVRDWLFRKRRETWRGRAELHLDQLAAGWSQDRQPRFLPSLGEYLTILCGVPLRRRTSEEQALLSASTRRHGLRWGSALVLLLAAILLVRGYIISVRSKEGAAASRGAGCRRAQGASRGRALRH